MQLNRELILNAAFGILDTYGLGDLSMRRLARSLDVAPGALYWHFPSKQALLGAIADRILTPPDAVSHQGDAGTWRERTLIAATALLDRLLSTRDGADIVSAALATGAVAINPVTPLSAALTAAPGADPDLAAWVLVRYLLGAATELQTAHAADTEPWKPDPPALRRILTGVELILNGISVSGTVNTTTEQGETSP